MYTKIIAHRGACKAAPENTLPAFTLAAELGADGIELDVQLTKDGIPVVLHDDTIERTSNGSGPVNTFTLEELRQFDFSAGVPGFENTKIPTLEEVYAFAGPRKLLVNVEIKATGAADPVMEKALLILEHRFGMREQVLYSSFNHDSLISLKKAIPHAKLAALYMATLHRPWLYARSMGAAALHPYIATNKPQNMVVMCRAFEVELNPWTVDDKEQLVTLLKAGVNGIITNLPEVALALRREIQHTK